MATPSTTLSAAVYSKGNIERLQRDRELYLMYNGKVRDTVKAAIIKEFKKPETISELLKRVIPINIVQKVVNKLGAVYKAPPERKPADDAGSDEEALSKLIEIIDLNSKMKLFNRYVKLTKASCLEPYVNDDMKPAVRVLPSHTFTQYSDSAVDPECPTYTIKHLDMMGDRATHRHIVWSKERHYLMDGYGKIIEEYNNPYGINPIVYVKDGIELMPVQDDDLYYLQIAICLLLTDLAFAGKFQSWSVIAIIGASETQNLTFNPNSIIGIPNSKDGTQGDIKVIQPKVDTDGILSMVEALVGLLLTTKNLSVGNVSLKLHATDNASGVAKILDLSESTEDKQDQRAMLITAEKELFENFKIMIPVWLQDNAIDPKIVDVKLSDTFVASVQFHDPKPQTSEKEVVETEIEKLDNHLTTLEMSLARIYPDKTQQEISDLKDLIVQEAKDLKEILKPTTTPAAPTQPGAQGNNLNGNGQGQNNGQPATSTQNGVQQSKGN